MIRTMAPLAVLALLLAGCAAPEEATPPTPGTNETNATPTPVSPTPASPTMPAPTLPPAPDPTAPPLGPPVADANATPPSPRNGAGTGDLTSLGQEDDGNGTDANASAGEGTAENGTWPVNGSYVTYTIQGKTARGRAMSESWTNATWEFVAGEWALSCDGRFNGTLDPRSRDPKWRNGTFATHGPTRLMDGGSPLVTSDERARGRLADREMVVWRLVQCEPEKLKMMKVGPSVANVTLEGEPVTLDAHRGVDGRLTRDRMREFKWDPDTGLVLAWTMLDRRSSQQGWLTSTDAPIGDAPEAAPVPAPSPADEANETMEGNETMDVNATPGADVPSDANATV